MKPAIPILSVSLALTGCGGAADTTADDGQSDPTTQAQTSAVAASADESRTRSPDRTGSGTAASPNPEMAYFFKRGPRGPVLSFGVPATDNIALSLRCPAGGMGETVLVSFNRPAEIVAQRPDTIDLVAGSERDTLAVDTTETQLGTTVEGRTGPDSPPMSAFREGTQLTVRYGEETVAIPGTSPGGEIGRFFDACNG